MKNNAKRLLAFLLAALLCVTMVVPAFATEADAAHDHDHKVSCDADCTHECETNHENSEVIEVVKSVCTAAGYTLKYCFDCEHYFVADVVPAEEGAAHNPGEKVEEGKAATCVSEGVETSYKCTVCGELCDKDGGEVDTIDVIDHEYKDGLCVICGKHEDDSCVGEHVWEFVEVTVEATATTNGTATYKCTVCGAKKEVVIKATSGEAERIYPDSIYVDVDFANGVATDRLGNATLENKGTIIGATDVKHNGTTINVEALQITSANANTFVKGTFTNIKDIAAMNEMLAKGWTVEALYLDNSSYNNIHGIVCVTQNNGAKSPNTINWGWGIAERATGVPYFITGNGVTGKGYNYVDSVLDAATAETMKTELVHVIAVYNPADGTHSVYINGELSAATAKNAVPGIAAPDIKEIHSGVDMFNMFYLGGDPTRGSGDCDFPNDNLTIVDAKIYAGALTAEEVKMLYGYVVEDFTEKEVVDELAWVKEILAENNLSIEGYDVLELETYLNAYYNSSDANSKLTKPGYSALVSASNGSVATNLVNFYTTEIVENAKIPAGSIIVVKDGYGYRPDGWEDLEKKSSARPGEVYDQLTVVTTDWFKTYNYRAFNVFEYTVEGDKKVKGEITAEDLGALVILTPKTHTCGKDTLTEVEAVAGTCTEKGTIAHFVCSCGKLYADAEATTLITSIEGDFGHTYGEKPTEFVDATCDKYGYKLWACELCGDVKAENITPKGHAAYTDEERATNVVKVDATCTKDGKVTWTCDCGKEMSETLTKTGCTLVTVEVAATCHTYAYTFTYCTNANCDATSATVADDYIVTVDGKAYNVVEFTITGNELNPENHWNVVTEVVIPATCTTAGTKVTYCKGCHVEDIYFSYELDGHEYDYDNETLVTPATCTAAAQYKALCKHCGAATTYAKGEALGHKYGDVQTTPATCAAKGEKYQICSECGDKKVVEVLEYKSSAVNGIYSDYKTAASEHKIIEGSIVNNYRPGTCELVGLVRYTCETCGYIFVQTGEGGKGHDFETITPGKDATCTEDGYTAVEKCKDCGYTTVSVTINKLGHDLEEVVAKDATCTEDGDVAHFHCDTCGKNFKDAEATEEITTAVVIPATGHNYVAGVCTNCNEKCAHKYAPIASNVASCDEDALYDGYGFTHFACPECGDEFWTNFVVTPAHDYEEGVIVTAPNCTTEGKKADVCKECGKETNVVVLPETHYNAEGEAIVDSCLDTTEDRVCDVCGETIAKSHNIVVTKVNNTCKELGYTITACGDCGEVLDTVANAEFGDHVWLAPTVVDSTYTTEGTKTYVCDVCGENKVETIEKKSGLNIDLVATNKYGYDAYVDGSYVTVKVVADANNVDLWSYRINVNYDNTVLTYVGYEINESVCGTTVSGLAHNNNTYVTVLGYVSNTADADKQNATLNGEDIVIATLTFQVIKPVEGEDAKFDRNAKAEFSIADVEMIERNNTDVVEKLGSNLVVGTEEIEIETYLDINNDGVRDIEDLNAMDKLLKNVADEDVIEAAADANHDGTIGETDLSILMKLLVGAKTYTTYAEMAK